MHYSFLALVYNSHLQFRFDPNGLKTQLTGYFHGKANKHLKFKDSK